MPAKKLLHVLVELLFMQLKVLVPLFLSLHLVRHHEGIEVEGFPPLLPALHFQFLLPEYQGHPAPSMLLVLVLGCALAAHYRCTQ